MKQQDTFRGTPSGRRDILTVPEACALLSVHRNTLYRLIQTEGLPAFKLSAGGKWRLRRSDVADWIEDRQGRRP